MLLDYDIFLTSLMKRRDICWSRCCMAQKAVSAPRLEDAVPYHEQAQPPMAHVWGTEDRTLNSGCCSRAASTGQTYNKGCRYTGESVEWVGVTQDWLSLSSCLSRLQPCGLSFPGLDSCSWGQQQSCTNRVATRPQDHWPQPPGILSALHKAFICTPWARRGPAAPSSLLVGDGGLGSALEAQAQQRDNSNSDDSTHDWARRCWKSWVFDSTSKEASSPVSDLVHVITSMGKSLISLVVTVKHWTTLAKPSLSKDFSLCCRKVVQASRHGTFSASTIIWVQVDAMMYFP